MTHEVLPGSADDQPRHLRIDERPPVRELDGKQLAAEAVASLRAEREAVTGGDQEPGLVPFDESPAVAPAPEAVSDGGRHRRPADSPPRPVTPARHLARSPSTAPAAGGPDAPERGRRSTDPQAPRRSRRPRWVGWTTALGVAAVAGVGVYVVTVDRDPVTPTGTSTPVAEVVLREPVDQGPVTPEVTGTSPLTTAATPPPTLPSPSSSVPASAAPVPGRPTDGAVTTALPAPAVVSTLSPGDDGFGWPSTAFGSVSG